MKERQVDIVIIGSGSAGLNAMAQARQAGRSFVLINGGMEGTTCARIGCMQSKVMIHIAEEYYRRTHFGQYGIDGHDGLSLDLTEAMKHVLPFKEREIEQKRLESDALERTSKAMAASQTTPPSPTPYQSRAFQSPSQVIGRVLDAIA